MSGEILRFANPMHKAVEELLPWFLNGTLEGEELAVVERHLRECVRCQHELDALRELQVAYVGSEGAHDPTQSFHKLRDRMAESRPKRGRVLLLAGLRRLWQRAPVWAPWAAAAELAIIFVLGSALMFGGEASALYRTLAAAAVSPRTLAQLVVVFDSRITEAELRQILRATGARIVDGPTSADGYVLELPIDRQTSALEALRAQRAVVLAERLDAGKRR